MNTLSVIHKTREYLDYVEEHYNNVQKAYSNVRALCEYDTNINWEKLYDDVVAHDMSKLSKDEFVQYREAFYPVVGKVASLDKDAWEHHKIHNSHHWETIEASKYINDVDRQLDLVHMVIDWTAMSYKFGGSAEQYYRDNVKKIKLSTINISFINKVFELIR